MIRILHPVAGGVALITILSFWLATVFSELFAGPAMIALVKTTIPWGFFILIPALAMAGGSGFRLAARRRGPLIDVKRRRVPVIAANGVLILVPAALFLAMKAEAGAFDAVFFLVQALELAAGAINITLLCLNMRDGLRLTSGRRRLA